MRRVDLLWGRHDEMVDSLSWDSLRRVDGYQRGIEQRYDRDTATCNKRISGKWESEAAAAATGTLLRDF